MANRRRGSAVVGLAFLIIGAIACGSAPLANTQPSAAALANEVLAAIARADELMLRSLALNEDEFRRHVWPALPAARPERNLPFSYVWGDLRQKSDNRLRAMLSSHGGRVYHLQKVSFSGATTEYSNFHVHRDAVLTVRDSVGADYELKLFGAAIESAGGWKIFSFNVDE